MAIRKSVEETLVVGGSPEQWFASCEQALKSQKFKKVVVTRELGQVKGDYKPMIGTLHGDVLLVLVPDGANTRIEIKATAAADNVYALGRSPGAKLIEKFKEGLLSSGFDITPPVQDTKTPTESMSEELERLADLHERGALDAEEFKAAKSRLLEG